MKLSATLLLFILISCNVKKDQISLHEIISGSEQITGKTEYLGSPFVAAGDRVYVVGHQDGSFPDLGWHVTGEMGGIWDHPIKLMDGYSLNVSDPGLDWCLTDAKEFVNYPFGNRHIFENGALMAERFQFVPEGKEGVIIEYKITNNGQEEVNIDLSFTAHIDLTPVWLAEELEIEDGTDTIIETSISNAFAAKDGNNDWYVVFGSDNNSAVGENSPCSYERKGNGLDHTTTQQLAISSGASVAVKYFISGSYNSLKEAETTYTDLQNDYESLLTSKINQYDSLSNTADLVVSDTGINEMYKWIKYNTQWLVRDVKEQGRGVSAGIPDYPWWFGTDGAYIIQGLVSSGFHEEAISTIELIYKLSHKVNGRTGKVMHEASTNGVVFNEGNVNTTPSFIIALWKAYAWTADPRILNYYEDIKKGISWIEAQDKDGNGYPDGHGIMEIHGLDSEMADVAAYFYKAYLAAANFARVKKDTELYQEYRNKAAQLREKINSDWWVEQANSYADFRCDNDKFLELAEAAIVRIDTLNVSDRRKEVVKEEIEGYIKSIKRSGSKGGTKGHVLHHNWVVNTPMEVGAADPEKATLALETAKNYVSKFGMYVTGMDKKEDQEEATKWKQFSYLGAVMTLPTGVQAIAEANYGNVDQALEYVKLLENSFSYALPGSMYEVSPDFGMIAQGWNIYAVAVPIIDHFFGIQPIAHNKAIWIDPKIPSSWPSGKLLNVPIGDNLVSIEFERKGEAIEFKVYQKLGWDIIFVGKDGTEQFGNLKENSFQY